MGGFNKIVKEIAHMIIEHDPNVGTLYVADEGAQDGLFMQGDDYGSFMIELENLKNNSLPKGFSFEELVEHIIDRDYRGCLDCFPNTNSNIYKVEVKETLSSVFEVRATSQEEALEIINNKYRQEEIVLMPDNIVDTEIKIYDAQALERSCEAKELDRGR